MNKTGIAIALLIQATTMNACTKELPYMTEDYITTDTIIVEDIITDTIPCYLNCVENVFKVGLNYFCTYDNPDISESIIQIQMDGITYGNLYYAFYKLKTIELESKEYYDLIDKFKFKIVRYNGNDIYKLKYKLISYEK